MATNLSNLPNGYMLSEYRIDGLLGQGGFGITYLATDTMLNRQVAIKEYYPREFAVREGTRRIRASGNQEDQETFAWGLTRFLEEARILARFEHPNIIAVRRFFEKNGTAYLVMDYCNGRPLDEIIKHDGPLSPAQLVLVLNPLLDGLEQIHNTNFLHRDIKPANLFIRSDGSPVLLDFGAARHDLVGHSRSLTSLATPGYAAFEQYSTNGNQGPWTDIYGLGATLYRAVTGMKPLPSPDRMLEDTLEPASKLAHDRFLASHLKAIDAAMALRPEHRPQSVAKLRSLFNASSTSRAKATLPPILKPLPKKSLPTTPKPLGSDQSKLVWKLGYLIRVMFHSIRIELAGLLAAGLFLGGVLLILNREKVSEVKASIALPRSLEEQSKPSPISVAAEVQDCADCPNMVAIPAGDFTMGFSAGEADLDFSAGPQHRVTISRSMYVGKYEVTFKEWDACVKDQGCSQRPVDNGWGRANLPVINVSWIDALAYVDWLSIKTGKSYRLLSEAEWEYAARAGSTAAYSVGDSTETLSRNAWFNANSKDRTHAVGEKLPNNFGLYDMHGNVWEWTQDCWSPSYSGAPTDGSARLDGDCSQRVLRGGSWANGPSYLRSAYRAFATAANRSSDNGFRVARTD